MSRKPFPFLYLALAVLVIVAVSMGVIGGAFAGGLAGYAFANRQITQGAAGETETSLSIGQSTHPARDEQVSRIAVAPYPQQIGFVVQSPGSQPGASLPRSSAPMRRCLAAKHLRTSESVGREYPGNREDKARGCRC